MPDLSIFKTGAPYHILAYVLHILYTPVSTDTIRYGTLLGSQVFQSFIGGIVAFKALPRPQFAALQQKIFPIYFSMQTALPIILALTYPGARTPLGAASGLGGTFAKTNQWSTLVPMLMIFGTSLANLLVVGPATTKIMHERKHQGALVMSGYIYMGGN